MSRTSRRSLLHQAVKHSWPVNLDNPLSYPYDVKSFQLAWILACILELASLFCIPGGVRLFSFFHANSLLISWRASRPACKHLACNLIQLASSSLHRQLNIESSPLTSLSPSIPREVSCPCELVQLAWPSGGPSLVNPLFRALRCDVDYKFN